MKKLTKATLTAAIALSLILFTSACESMEEVSDLNVAIEDAQATGGGDSGGNGEGGTPPPPLVQ